MNNNLWQVLEKPIIGLAPMDGITDAAFREITAKYSKPSVLITEFTTVEGMAHGAVKPLRSLLFKTLNAPIIAQIFGTTPAAFYKACFVIAELGFDGIDINMGCPVKKISSQGAGAGLIGNPKLAQEIIKTCQRAVVDWTAGKTMAAAEVDSDIIDYVENFQALHHKKGSNSKSKVARNLIPISVKTRTGIDKIITEDWMKTLLECKPDNITLHGRTLTQLYSGSADWDEIYKASKIIKQSGLDTTFLGNGDVVNIEDAREKSRQYNLDGVLVGRATFGNPWFFDNHLPSFPEKMKVALEHCLLYEEIYGQGDKIFGPMRKHLGWYCRGFDGAKEIRMQLMQCNSSKDVEKVMINNNLIA